MKRKAALISILLMLSFTLTAKVTYQPSLSFTLGPVFTYKTDDMLRSSFKGRLDLDPLALNIDAHTISFPISFAYVTKTPFYNNYCLNSHIDFTAGLAYRYDFNDSFTLKAQMDVILRYVQEVQGGIMGMDFIAEPGFYLGSHVIIGIPLTLGISKQEFNFSPAISITALPWGGRK